jgi:phosphoribosylaminoimidazolecarboxamide formyltransferase/IMP cyclohydrolase
VILKAHSEEFLSRIVLIDKETAMAINEIFFEVLMAPVFEKEALDILQTKKNRILLQVKPKSEDTVPKDVITEMHRSLLNGELIQTIDEGILVNGKRKEEGSRLRKRRKTWSLPTSFANI